MRRQIGLLCGVFASASSVVFIRESEAPPIMLAAYRCLIAALILSPLAYRAWRQTQPRLRDTILATGWPALVLALHFISWNIGARLTPAANATLIVSLVPLAMPIVLWVMLRERISHRERIATAVASAGLVILAITDFDASPAWLLGDMVCFGSMALMAVYLVYSRKNADGTSLWLYLVPLYAVSGLLCLAAGALLEGGYWPSSGYQGTQLLAIAVVPMVIGHSILNWGMRVFSGQHVALVNLLQFVFAGLLAYWLYAETPHLSFVLTATTITLAAAWVISARQSESAAAQR